MTNYYPDEIEAKWSKKWEENSANDAAVDLSDKPKYYPLIEFPYPSGSGLHIGHAFACMVPDIYARYKRAKGFNVLFPMGWDAFGLPTENYAVKTGIQPAVATKQNTDKFREQMKRIGLSFDWSREINTTDSDYYKWTQWIFIQLFKHGLAYKAKTPVGWCPSCKVVLANEEIVGDKCERCGTPAEKRMQEQWLLRITAYADRLIDELDLVDFPDYVKASQRNWIGKSSGALIRFKVSHSRHSGKKSSTRPESSNNNVGFWTSQDDDYIEVFTTRPDTLHGATFMVIAPEHPIVAELLNVKSQKSKVKNTIQNSKVASQGNTFQVACLPAGRAFDSWNACLPARQGGGIGERIKEIKAYVEQAKRKSEMERTELNKEKTGVDTGLRAINPANGKEMPIWISDFVIGSYGTGAIMSVPAHDKRDWEFAKKFGLEITPVVRCKPTTPSRCNTFTPSEEMGLYEEAAGELINSREWNGLEMPKDIDKIIEWFEEKGIGKKSVTYHLRDWVFSRQHYWGEPIPLVFCENCAVNVKSQKFPPWADQPMAEKVKDKSSEGELQNPGWFAISESDLPLKLPEVDRYQPTDTGESPLAKISDWVNAKCPNCGGPAHRETDTMPNWAGSSWYYWAYLLKGKYKEDMGDEANSKCLMFNSKLFEYWLPVDIYFGGAEHTTLHLLYSRFWHKFLNDIGLVPGKEPYQRRYQHGVILGPDGSRMSKSRGNVINPEDVINKFGADTLRVYLAFMGPYDAVMPWSVSGVEGTWRFLNRVWDFYHPPAGGQAPDKIADDKNTQHPGGEPGLPPGEMGKRNIDLVRELHKTIKKVGEDIENMKQNTAVAALMEFMNSWNRLGALSKEDAVKFLQLLAPFAPFMAEELFEYINTSGVAGRAQARSDSPEVKEIADSSTIPGDLRPPGRCSLGEGFSKRKHSGSELGLSRSEISESIHSLPWPSYDENLIVDEKTTIAIQVNGKLRGELAIDTSRVTEKEFIEAESKDLPSVTKHLEGKKMIKVVYVEGKIINFVTVEG